MLHNKNFQFRHFSGNKYFYNSINYTSLFDGLIAEDLNMKFLFKFLYLL